MAENITLLGERQKQAAVECNKYLDACGHKDALCMAYFEGWQRADQTNTNLPKELVMHALDFAVKEVVMSVFDGQADGQYIAGRVEEKFMSYFAMVKSNPS